MTHKVKLLEILRIVVHLGAVEAEGDILKKNRNQATIPQDGEGAIAAKNPVPVTLPQNHRLHGGALEE